MAKPHLTDAQKSTLLDKWCTISDGYTEACSVAAADYQQKYRQVSQQLEKLKPELLNSAT